LLTATGCTAAEGHVPWKSRLGLGQEGLGDSGRRNEFGRGTGRTLEKRRALGSRLDGGGGCGGSGGGGSGAGGEGEQQQGRSRCAAWRKHHKLQNGNGK